MEKKYNDNIKLNNINTLTLITSESCNLQCKYCEIAKNINPETHNLITKKIKESFINGQYLENINNIFEKYEIDGQNIKAVNFWGQEPTITLDAVEIFFPKLYELIPNCNNLFFSTNGVAYPDKIINFIKMLDKTIINKEKNKKFEFRIQFSYDGKNETKKLRGIDPEVILKNINFIIQQLNNIKLTNIKIAIQFHNVISMDLVERLNTVNKGTQITLFSTAFEIISFIISFKYIKEFCYYLKCTPGELFTIKQKKETFN